MNAFTSQKITFASPRDISPGGFLVVDDVSINVYITSEMLQSYGLPVDTAGSGAEAIYKIKQGNRYDIIFMDHMMPDINGIEATKEIRSFGYMGCIVVLTADDSGENNKLYIESGFNKIMTKPVDENEISSLINETIAADREESPQKTVSDGGIFTVLDDNDSLSLEELFLMDAEAAIGTLEEILAKSEPVSADNIDLYEITVHGIKSALRNINRQELAEEAYKLELAAKDGNFGTILSDTAPFLEKLKGLMAEIA